MLSDPGAIRALYGNAGHGLPPGRSFALLPILGPRSLLLLEGRDHLARRRLMLPPFHGERMRAYESTVREVVARDVETWPEREPFAIHPCMQSVTLEVILRAVFGVTDQARTHERAFRLTPTSATGPPSSPAPKDSRQAPRVAARPGRAAPGAAEKVRRLSPVPVKGNEAIRRVAGPRSLAARVRHSFDDVAT
jgi:cytochrome P450